MRETNKLSTADKFALTIILIEAAVIAGGGAVAGGDLAFCLFVGAFIIDLLVIAVAYKYFGEQRDIR